MSNSIYNIEKLDESNYDSWSVQMKSVLVHQSLWTVVSGDLKKPSDDEIDTWSVCDERAKATILLSIKPAQISFVKNCGTAMETWKTLEDMYRPAGPVCKVTLFKQLLSLRMSDDDSVQQYICSFTNVVEKLAEIGVTFQEELFGIMLLASLPKSYENFVVALETRDELPKLSFLRVKLMEEGERRKGTGEVPYAEQSVQAFLARANNGKIPKKVNGSNGTNSYNCKRQNFKCYNCGRKGHYAAQCRDVKKEQREQKPEQKQQSTSSATAFSVFIASQVRQFGRSSWCVDSGATSHLCCNRNMFEAFEESNDKIALAGEHCIYASGRGDVRIKSKNMDIKLKDVLFVPELQCNFISVSKAVNNNHMVIFEQDCAKVKNSDGKNVLTAKKLGNLFIFQMPHNETLHFTNNVTEKAIKWHNRYGHLNYMSLSYMVNKKLVHGLEINAVPKDIKCEVCLKSKFCAKPFSRSESKSKELLEIIHSDVCGPINKLSNGGAKYILTFIDDKSRYVFVYFLKAKDEVFETFKRFKAEKQKEKKIKIVRSDNGTEYRSKAFDKYLEENGIKRHLTVAYTPQQNGVAERFNRTLIEMARSMLLYVNVSESLCAEPVNTAVYLQNRSPTKALDNMTPYEMWSGQKPSVSHLKIFGSLAIALDKTQRCKFRAKGKQYLMVGYFDTSKAYRLYDHITRRVWN